MTDARLSTSEQAVQTVVRATPRLAKVVSGLSDRMVAWLFIAPTMALLLAGCRTPDVQQRVTAGLRAFRATCRAAGGSFESLPRADRERLLRDIDAAARLAGDAHWYSTVRELALTSYFTSEVGMTRATRYVPIPGRYQGCMPLEPGQPAWG